MFNTKTHWTATGLMALTMLAATPTTIAQPPNGQRPGNGPAQLRNRQSQGQAQSQQGQRQGQRQGQGEQRQQQGQQQGTQATQQQQQQQQQQAVVPVLVAALDANGDSIISKAEIANAYELLRKLDKNSDGKLSPNEFRGSGSPAGPQGAGGQQRPAAGPGRGPGQQPGAGGQQQQRGPRQQGAGGQRGPGGAGGPGGQQGQGPRQGAAQQAQSMLEVNPSEVNPRDLPDRPRDIRFRNAIEVGKQLSSEIEIYNTDQQRIPMRKLFRDRPTVVVCGCLTCPAFLTAYSEVEAVHADYKDKVDFYFLYHVLAHPENRGYVQPMTIEERFLHIEEAKRTLGTSIPWIADTMDNELKELYVWASNPEFIFAPNGQVVHREPWSRGTALREQLEKLVGPSARTTTVAELKLPEIERVSEGQRTGELKRVQVSGVAVPVKFETQQSNEAWYAKLRPEIDQQLLNTGTGQLYLGFHLDPIHHVHWNNLADPLTYEITGPNGVRISPATAEATRPKAETDHDPREFLVDVEGWSTTTPLTVKVFYMACNKTENWCKPVQQQYKIYPTTDPAAGRVNGRTHKAGGAPSGGGGGGRAGQGQRGGPGGQRGGGGPRSGGPR